MGDALINVLKKFGNTIPAAALIMGMAAVTPVATFAGAAGNAATALQFSDENGSIVQAQFAQSTVENFKTPTRMGGLEHSQLIDVDFAPPADDAILTVSGAISLTNVDDTAAFDLDALMALPKTEYTTSTIWTDGEIRFTGVALSDLMEVLGGDPESIVAKALNDYSVTITKDDIGPDYPIIAYHMDGETFSRREKGPLWIVFPYDRSEEFQQELVYGLSVWQLETLTVE